MTKTKKIVYYVLLVIVSALFLFSAFGKLTGDPMQAASFASAHLPIWFMYFIGAAELLGAIGLWIPKLQKWAAHGLSIILVGAVVVTLFFTPMPLAAIFPAIIIAILWYVGRLARKLRNVAPAAPVTPAPTV